MLRLPAAFELPHALDPETSYPYLAFVTAACIVTAIATLLSLRRLRIAESWARTNTFSQNELLHNIATLLLPMKLARLVGLIGFYRLGEESDFANCVGFTCLVVSMGCLIYVGKREHDLLKQIRNTTSSFSKSSTILLRMLAGYAALSAFSTIIGLLLALTISNSLAALVAFLATVIVAQLACSPILMRLVLPNSSAAGTELETLVHEAFKKMHRPRPLVRILELNDHGVFNAMIVGSGLLPGPFRQTVLMSQSPALSLTTNELRAIIHHELAHGHLHHLPLRVITAATVNLSLLAMMASVALILPENPIFETFLIAACIAAIVVMQTRLLGRLVQDQEKQADEFAVFKMESNVHDLISALAKLTTASGGLRDRKPAGHWLSAATAHPTVDERQDHLHQLETQIRTGRLGPEAVSRRLSAWRFRSVILGDSNWRALGGALAVALVTVFARYGLKRDVGPSRTPASTVNSKEIEKYLRKVSHET